MLHKIGSSRSTYCNIWCKIRDVDPERFRFVAASIHCQDDWSFVPAVQGFSLLPVRVRVYGPLRDTGWQTFTNQSGRGRIVHRILQRGTSRRKLRVQHATNSHCGRTRKKNVLKCHPNVLWTATFPVRFTRKFGRKVVKGFQETDLAGYPSGERPIRYERRNFDRKSLFSQPSVGNKVFAVQAWTRKVNVHKQHSL